VGYSVASGGGYAIGASEQTSNRLLRHSCSLLGSYLSAVALVGSAFVAICCTKLLKTSSVASHYNRAASKVT
jgi:hypothetical protein